MLQGREVGVFWGSEGVLNVCCWAVSGDVNEGGPYPR